MHGVVVDPESKVWIIPYGAMDSIWTSSGYRRTRSIYVLHPDGTSAPFSPIKVITVGGVPDTLYPDSRGIALDHQGNILYSSRYNLYRINYQTGEGMTRVTPQPNVVITAASADLNGNVFVGKVLPGNTIQAFNSDFNFIGNVETFSPGYSRTLIVSADGNGTLLSSISTRKKNH